MLEFLTFICYRHICTFDGLQPYKRPYCYCVQKPSTSDVPLLAEHSAEEQDKDDDVIADA